MTFLQSATVKCLCIYQLVLDTCYIRAKFPLLGSDSLMEMEIKITCTFKSSLIHSLYSCWSVLDFLHLKCNSYCNVQQSQSNKSMTELQNRRLKRYFAFIRLNPISYFNKKLLNTLCD